MYKPRYMKPYAIMTTYQKRQIKRRILRILSHVEGYADARSLAHIAASRLMGERNSIMLQYDREATDALHAFGDHGSLISGCVRDHFPEGIKDRLRHLARRITDCSDSFYLLNDVSSYRGLYL